MSVFQHRENEGLDQRKENWVYEENNQYEPALGKGVQGVKRYRLKVISIAAALALVLGAAPLYACTATSSVGASSSSVEAASGSMDSSGENAQASGGDASMPPSDGAMPADGGTPPEMTSGQSGSAGAMPPSPPDGQGSSSGMPPDMPNSQGGSNGSAPPDMPNSQGSPDGSAPPDMPSGSSGPGGPGGTGGPGGPGGADTMTFDYTGEYVGVASADGEETFVEGETIEATESDQNVGLAINGGSLTITSSTLEKSGDDTNGDRCNFYGANSIVLAVNEASKILVSDSALAATSEGSNGLFATDSGTVFANNVTINTTAGNSRGLDATYGGTVVANELNISTQGDHCASIATDRGGGNISVTSSTLATAGSGSPILYSTGDIEVDNITGTATGSQLVGMEGLNTVMISNSHLTSTVTGRTASDPIADGIIIYQSTSGDAEASTGETALFQVTDSTLSSSIQSGALFYLTNTSAKAVLSNTQLDFDSDEAKLIVAAGNDSNNWGTPGSNGATATFTGIDQDFEGDIEVDTISVVDFFLLDGSSWEGAANIVENSASSTNADHLNVSIDSTSKWIVTEDSTVTNLNLASGGKLVDKKGKAVKVADADGNVLVEGASDITVAVTDDFSTSVTTTEANSLEDADVDRSAFDEAFGITTTFGENGSSALGAVIESGGSDNDDAQKARVSMQAVLDWFANLK